MNKERNWKLDTGQWKWSRNLRKMNVINPSLHQMLLRVTGAWTTDYTPTYTFWPNVKYKTKINSGQVLDLTETNIIYHHQGHGLTWHPSTFCIRNKKVTLTFKAKSLCCDSLQTSWCLRIAIVVSRACHFGILLGKIMKLSWMWEYGHRMLPPNDGGGPSPAQPSPASIHC